jgi:PilZ domain
MFSTAENTERNTERVEMSLPVRVEAREAHNTVWRELTHLESVSESGAGFYLTRLFEVGRILFLTLPLGRDLRRYSQDDEQYAVWAIVRHCHRTLRNKFPVYHVGTAFIGAQPPVGYRKNPLTTYHLGELKEDGFYAVTEDGQPASTRAQRRYTIPIEIYIAVFDAEENIIAHEKTVTENISESGAAVFSSLQLNTGDSVKIIKQHGGFSADAVVRARRVGKDNLPRLHLEFINARFPLDGIG